MLPTDLDSGTLCATIMGDTTHTTSRRNSVLTSILSYAHKVSAKTRLAEDGQMVCASRRELGSSVALLRQDRVVDGQDEHERIVTDDGVGGDKSGNHEVRERGVEMIEGWSSSRCSLDSRPQARAHHRRRVTRRT